VREKNDRKISEVIYYPIDLVTSSLSAVRVHNEILLPCFRTDTTAPQISSPLSNVSPIQVKIF